jgi:DSF synthase
MLDTRLDGARPFTEAGDPKHLRAHYDEARRALWVLMDPSPRPCFNRGLMGELLTVAEAVQSSELPVDYWVTGSLTPGVFNLGGDLELFVSLIRSGDRAGLHAYAQECADCVHRVTQGTSLSHVITIALVDGLALGGGFESALAHHFVLARRGVGLGFPETAFNTYPGMGAYPLAVRRAGMKVAERLIREGDQLPAEWHEERGLVDVVFEKGQGVSAAHRLMDSISPKINGIRGMLRSRERTLPVSRDELLESVADWAESAFLIEEKDLQTMERLIKLQDLFLAAKVPAV